MERGGRGGGGRWALLSLARDYKKHDCDVSVFKMGSASSLITITGVEGAFFCRCEGGPWSFVILTPFLPPPLLSFLPSPWNLPDTYLFSPFH